METKEIKKLIKKALNDAANFKAVDLHIHSDESNDFPRECSYNGEKIFPEEKEKEKNLKPEDFLDAARTNYENRLDLISITDHMKFRKSCEISQFSRKEIVSLPGIEVGIRISETTEESIHLLCIFEEGKSSEDIEHIFSGITDLLPYDKRKDDYSIKTDIKSFIEKVHNKHGVCIAAHVNTKGGIRKAFFESDIKYIMKERELKALNEQKNRNGENWSNGKEQYLQSLTNEVIELRNDIQDKYLDYLIETEIDAIQVQKSSDYKFYSSEYCEKLKLKTIPAILSSDAHCLKAIGYPSKITFVKMTDCNWQNLKQALQDPQTRIRYSDNVNIHNFTKIKGIIFDGEDGFFKSIDIVNNQSRPQVFGFADNLTCLIGGRGSGKSATIDALRYVFKEKKELDLLPEKLREDIIDRLNHTLKNTTIYLLMENENGEEIIISILYDNWENRKYNSKFMNGEDAGINLSTSLSYSLDIYGWSEIENLGKDKIKQRELIDNFISGIKDVQERISEQKLLLNTNRQDLLRSAKELKDLIPTIKDFNEVKAAYDKINTPQMQSLFKELDIEQKKKAALEGLKKKITEIGEHIEMNYDVEETIKTAQSIIKKNFENDEQDEYKKWLTKINRNIFGKEEGPLSILLQAYERIKTAYDQIIQNLETEYALVETEIAKINNKIRTEESKDIRDLSNLNTRQRYKEKFDDRLNKKQQIHDIRKAVNEKLKERQKLLTDFLTLINRRSELREIKKDEINKELEETLKKEINIKIDFEKLGDRDEFEKVLGKSGEEDGILKGLSSRYKDRRFAQIISAHLNPIEFSNKILNSDKSAFILSHPDGNDEIRVNDSQNIFEHLNPEIEEYDEKYYSLDKLKTILQLQEIEIDDYPIIKLNDSPISGLSPGQRCSSLLPIILLQGNRPLIIDQPEDNLDNRLVFDLVVDILRNLKERRQIIVATHNPNIPVSGDAEQILVFESIDRDSGQVTIQGSVDSPEIIKAVKEIMEGGEEAFEIRAKKYRYSIRNT